VLCNTPDTLLLRADGYWFTCRVFWECSAGVCSDGGTGSYREECGREGAPVVNI
jgi:hypothetical protein